MNQPGRPVESKLQIEYLEDAAVIRASGKLRGCSKDRFQSAMKDVLEAGYRLVVIDLFDSEGMDLDAVADLTKAVFSAESLRPDTKVAIVQNRGSLEWKGEAPIIDPLPFWMERSHYTRDDALDALRKVNKREQTLARRWWSRLLPWRGL